MNNEQNNKNNKWKNILIGIIVVIVIFIVLLTIYVVLDKKDNNVDDNKENNQQQENDNNNENEKISYEIKVEDNIKYLYVNNSKVTGISAIAGMGSIEVKKFKDLLIVDEAYVSSSKKLFVVDKNGNATEIDYEVSTYNSEFINSIDSYRMEGNNLYIKVNRQWENGYIDWYCRYEDKNEVAEYEIKYEYKDGKLENKKVLNEVTISNKYKDEKCDNVQNPADDFFNSFKKKDDVDFKYVEDVGIEFNDNSAINLLKENVEILETVERGIRVDEYIYEIYNVNNISEETKISEIIYYYGHEKYSGEMVEDAVSADKVRQKYYELYGQNINFINEFDETDGKLNFTDKGSNYTMGSYTCSYREKTNMFACRPTSGGMGPGSSQLLKYTYNYKKDAEYYYVYVSVGRSISYWDTFDRTVISSEVDDLKIYKDSEVDGDLQNFKINETNYNDFAKYRYTFKLNEDGKTFKFISLDRVK